MLKKILRIVRLNLIALRTSELSVPMRVNLVLNEVVAVFLFIVGKREFRYLGVPFFYDNPSTIFTILLYPHEIMGKILRNVSDPVKDILEIGGNIGQFSVTFQGLGAETRSIDVFEPNEEIFPLLDKNVRNRKKIRIYNYGIGKEGKQQMYYTEGKSAKGSLLRENAKVGDKEPTEIEVKLVSDVPKITRRRYYDLVKIDVEGFEYDVIKNLRNIETKYLFIELSAGVRDRNYSTSEIYREIERKWGAFEIVHQTSVDTKSEAYDALLKFV